MSFTPSQEGLNELLQCLSNSGSPDTKVSDRRGQGQLRGLTRHAQLSSDWLTYIYVRLRYKKASTRYVRRVRPRKRCFALARCVAQRCSSASTAC